MTDLNKPLQLIPNIRWEPSSATSGYTWGKPADQSNILKMLPSDSPADLGIPTDATVAERWLCSDDPANPSLVVTQDDPISLRDLIDTSAAQLLGPQHETEHGEYLNCVMKQLDTNPEPNRGGLSVQIHPKPGHPTRPSKPEMWLGDGHVYLGWKNNVTEEQIKTAVATSHLEELMNQIELDQQTPVVVPGGAVHAIRSDTFLREWSKAPGRDDIAKGNMKDCTVALYDRTDGKNPRPGKEELAGSFEVMTHANSFKKTNPANIISQPTTIQKSDDFIHQALFRTAEVWVDRLTLHANFELSLAHRGLPLFVETGVVDIMLNDEHVDRAHPSDERFLPFALGQVTLVAHAAPATMYWWFSPFSNELKGVA